MRVRACTAVGGYARRTVKETIDRRWAMDGNSNKAYIRVRVRTYTPSLCDICAARACIACISRAGALSPARVEVLEHGPAEQIPDILVSVLRLLQVADDVVVGDLAVLDVLDVECGKDL